jgi:outer membrane receptor protein involved in Fe transport
MKTRKSTSLRRLVTLSVITFVGGQVQLFAQDVTTGGQAQEGADEEIIELSPFQVDATSITGYEATDTLSGSRIRSNLIDIASSITVVTEQFLEDTSSVGASDILSYIANGEGANQFAAADGLGGGFPNEKGALRGANRSRALRIRGLSGPDMSRNLQLSDSELSFDSYNTERVDINRGPNSILYGAGSPAGILNQRTKQARFDKNFGQLKFRFGKYDDIRASFDYNRVIAGQDGEGQPLAIRIAALYGDKGFRQQPSHENDRRFYGTIGWKPFPSTLVRFNIENIDIDAVYPNAIPPGDGITPWIAAGSPLWNPSVDVGSPASVDGLGLCCPNPSGPRAMFHFFEPGQQNPFFTHQITSGDPGTNGTGTFRLAGSATPYESFSSPLRITDANLFNFYDINLTPDSAADVAAKVFEFTIDQEIGNDLSIQFSYFWEDIDTEGGKFATGRDYKIMVDTNSHYLDGSPNPHVGRPYVQSAISLANSFGFRDRDASRFTATYDLDLAGKVNKWLGRHRLVGLYQARSADNYSFSNDARELATYLTPTPKNGQGTTGRWQYLGADVNSIPDSLDLRIGTGPVRTSNVLYFDINSDTWQTDTTGFETFLYPNRMSRAQDDFKTKSFIVQSEFDLPWLDRAVVTYGWREDESESRNGINSGFKTNDITYDGPRPLIDLAALSTLSDPSSPPARTTETLGIVGHVLPWLSVHWSDSENFKPGGEAYNVWGENVGSPLGDGRDYGFSMRLLDKKVSLKVNWFETTQLNNRVSRTVTVAYWRSWFYEVDEFPQKVAALTAAGKSTQVFEPATARGIDWCCPTGRANPRSSLTSSGNVAAKGMEIELTANPNPNWTLIFNLARQETVESEIAGGIVRWINTFQPYYETLDVWDSTEPEALNLWTGGTQKDAWTTHILERTGSATVREGARSTEQREWRSNFVTNYRITEGGLKGFNVGGGVRYESKAAIGYRVDKTSEGIPFFVADNPFTDDGKFDLDLWFGWKKRISDRGENGINMKIQLNFKNLLEGDGITPIHMNPDGVVSTYRINPPKMWFITTTFEF